MQAGAKNRHLWGLRGDGAAEEHHQHEHHQEVGPRAPPEERSERLYDDDAPDQPGGEDDAVEEVVERVGHGRAPAIRSRQLVNDPALNERGRRRAGPVRGLH